MVIGWSLNLACSKSRWLLQTFFEWMSNLETGAMLVHRRLIRPLPFGRFRTLR